MARSLEGGATVEVTKNGSKAPRAATAPPPARKINVCHRECPETRFFRADLGIATFDTQLSSGLRRSLRSSAIRPGLDALPLGFHLLQRDLAHHATVRLERRFDRLESARELLVGLAQRALGLDAKLSRQVGDREQQVAHFLLGA